MYAKSVYWTALLYKVSYIPSLLQILYLLIPQIPDTVDEIHNLSLILEDAKYRLTNSTDNCSHKLRATTSLTNLEQWLLPKVLTSIF
jgi:hypothetical protein